ncbi:hypothetical protein, partial [Amphritea sp.]|uniref:hypothetical protein n=1 Tax=Amphritea sp. TaxID=1872502 RepID=UPI003D141EFE
SPKSSDVVMACGHCSESGHHFYDKASFHSGALSYLEYRSSSSNRFDYSSLRSSPSGHRRKAAML